MEKLSEFELLGKRLGGFLIRLLKIAHQALALRHHFEQPAARMKVFLVLLEVVSKLLDPLGKHRNLILRRPRILLMPLHLFRRFRLLLRRQHSHFVRHRTRSFTKNKPIRARPL